MIDIVNLANMAFDECCVEGNRNFTISALAFSNGGVFTVINVYAGDFHVQACIPEDTPDDETWNGTLAVSFRNSGKAIKLTELIDAIQSAKDGKWGVKK